MGDHVETFSNIFQMFAEAPNGELTIGKAMVSISQVKLTLTRPGVHPDSISITEYEDDKIVFNVLFNGGTTKLEFIGMNLDMYLLKAESHEIYDFTRVLGDYVTKSLAQMSREHLKKRLIRQASLEPQEPLPTLV